MPESNVVETTEKLQVMEILTSRAGFEPAFAPRKREAKS